MTMLPLILFSIAAADTLVVSVEEALRMAETASPRLEAAGVRAEGAAHEIGRARAWDPPTLAGNVENFGPRDRVVGPELPGAEGQLVLSVRVPMGGDRRAAVAQAHARSEAAHATRDLARVEVLGATLEAIVAADRDRALLEQAIAERESMEAFTHNLRLGAAAGRFAAGDAARAELALVRAQTEEARRRAALAASSAELASALGLPLRSVVRVPIAAVCVAPAAGAPLDPLPDVRVAEAWVREADAALALAHARTVPDLHPQVGLRRTAGVDGLYLGFSVDLPFLGARGPTLAAARAERDAAAADRLALERELAAQRAGAASALEALESVGALHSTDWAAALELSVSAARMHYELGEGTLGDLLQAHQARAEGLRDHTSWLAEVRLARIRAHRLENRPLNAQALCVTRAS